MIVCDAGPIVAAVFANQPKHHAGSELFTGLRLAGRRLLSATVSAEVGYLIEKYGSPLTNPSGSRQSGRATSNLWP